MCGFIMTALGRSNAENMLNKISHRGLPGRSNIECINDIYFGHVRLPIQGLTSDFDQPYIEDSRLLLYAGEVFNWKSLPVRSKDSPSDTPAIFEALSRIDSFGDYSLLNKIDGFYSCIFHNKRTNTTHIITDPLSKKPLYIHLDSMSVSSEIKSFSEITNFQPDKLYFSSVRKFGYHFGPDTIYEGVKKIPPGCHVKIVDNDNSTMVNYIDLKIGQKVVQDPDPILLFKYLLQAVKNRLISDIPVSLLLSGGLDSTIIYNLVRKLHRGDINVYHIDNGEEEFLNYLRFPSNVKLHKINIHDDDYKLTEVLYANEGPVDLGSMIPQFLLCRKLKENGEHVVITGDGADELFGGYRRSKEYDSQYSDIFQELVYYHLPRLDKLGMYHTVEIRSPFLSIPVVNFALSIPYKKRIDKSFLREALSLVVPKEILHREKHPLKSHQVLLNGLCWSRTLCDKYEEDLMK